MKSNNKNNRGRQEVLSRPSGDSGQVASLSPEPGGAHHWGRKVIDGTVIVAVASLLFGGGRLYNTVSDLKEDRDKIAEKHQQILDDITKAKREALAQIQASALKQTNTVLLNRGKTVLRLDPSLGGQLVTLRLVGDGYFGPPVADRDPNGTSLSAIVSELRCVVEVAPGVIVQSHGNDRGLV